MTQLSEVFHAWHNVSVCCCAHGVHCTTEVCHLLLSLSLSLCVCVCVCVNLMLRRNCHNKASMHRHASHINSKSDIEIYQKIVRKYEANNFAEAATKVCAPQYFTVAHVPAGRHPRHTAEFQTRSYISRSCSFFTSTHTHTHTHTQSHIAQNKSLAMFYCQRRSLRNSSWNN